MKKEYYKRQPGDFEIRILKDGRLVMLAYDEKLLEVARTISPYQTNNVSKEEKEKELCQKTNQQQ